MNKKLLITLMIFSVLLSAGLREIYASDRDRHVTPYGDFCDYVTRYGNHSSIIDLKHAEEALTHYYKIKNLAVKIMSVRERFIKAEITDGNKSVDTVIFDRYSGRVRSIR